MPQLAGRVLEMDGLWTRIRAGPVEAGPVAMKVVRDENGVALGSFAGWGAVIDLAWQQGATAPVHLWDRKTQLPPWAGRGALWR